MIRWVLIFVVAGVVSCDRRETPPPAAAASEADYQVKRLREDTEIELQDLRGRWLAAEGLLTLQRDETKALRTLLNEEHEKYAERLDRMDVALGALVAELESVKNAAPEPAPRETVLDRLARSYEEIHCLRRQGAEEAVAAVYRRYGFEDVQAWSQAWQQAARSESFEREVSARVERLCP